MRTSLKPAANGVYRAPSDATLLRDLAQAAGPGWCEVDLRRIRGKRGLFAALARALHFPETFGGNWDALADCLQDLSWLSPAEAGTVLYLRGHQRFFVAAPGEAATLEEILAEAAQFWRKHTRLFVVLIDGAGEPLPYPPR